MADERTRALPTHRTEKRLVRMAGEAARGTARTRSGLAVRIPPPSMRWLAGISPTRILIISSTTLRRVLPVLSSTIVSAGTIVFVVPARSCWAALAS